MHTAFDVLCIPPYELLMGNIAKMTVMGWPGAPLHQFYDNCGGHLVTGLLAAPLFALFGESYLVLKLVPLALGLGTLLLMWSLLNRHFNRYAANLAVFLFVLGPPTLVKFSMLAMGNHFENLFFQMLVLWLFYRMHEAQRKGPWLVAFSAAAGFGVFIYFGTFVTLAVLAAIHLRIRGPRKCLRDALVGTGPMLVGITPLLWIQYHTIGRPARLLQTWSQGSGFFERLRNLLLDLLPNAGCYASLTPRFGSWAEGGLLLLFCVSWLTLLPRAVRGLWRVEADSDVDRERSRFEALRAAPLLAYLPAFAFVYGSSTFRFTPYGPPVEVGQFRYLVPHFCFACMLIGVGVSQHFRSPGWIGRLLGGGLLGIALPLMAVPFLLVDWSFAETGSGLAYRGYELRHYNNVLMRDGVRDPKIGQLRWDMDLLRSQLGDFDDPERHQIATGVGHHQAYNQGSPGRVEGKLVTKPHFDLQVMLAEFPDAALHGDVARGAGEFLCHKARAKLEQPGSAAGALRDLVEAGNPLAPYVVEGLCLSHSYPLARMTDHRMKQGRALERIVPRELRWAWVRGMGVWGGQLLERGIPSDRARILWLAERVPPGDRAEFWVGMGRGALIYGGRSASLTPLLEHAPAAESKHACFGYGLALRESFGLEAGRAHIGSELENLDPAQRAALERGLTDTGAPVPYAE
jgi:hypothetical protein